MMVEDLYNFNGSVWDGRALWVDEDGILIPKHGVDINGVLASTNMDILSWASLMPANNDYDAAKHNMVCFGNMEDSEAIDFSTTTVNAETAGSGVVVELNADPVAAGLAVNDLVQIIDGSNSEWVKITALVGGGTDTITVDLANSHAAGKTVQTPIIAVGSPITNEKVTGTKRSGTQSHHVVAGGADFSDNFNDQDITDWIINDGSTWSAVNQYLENTAGGAWRAIAHTFGGPVNDQTWTWKHKFSTLASDSDVNFYIMTDSDSQTGADGYFVKIRNSPNEFYLRRIDNGAAGPIIINSTWTPDTAWHDIKVTRSASGAFELFLDDVSKGTGTDTTHSTNTYIFIQADSSASLIDDIVIGAGAGGGFEQTIIGLSAGDDLFIGIDYKVTAGGIKLQILKGSDSSVIQTVTVTDAFWSEYRTCVEVPSGETSIKIRCDSYGNADFNIDKIICHKSIVNNGGFEAWTAGDPDGWTLSGGAASGEITEETTIVHSGGSSCHINVSAAAEGIEQFLSGLTADKWYSVVLYYFRKSGTFEALVDAGANNYSVTVSEGVGAWEKHVITFKAEGTTATLYLRSSGGATEGYVDDVGGPQLDEASPSINTPTTEAQYVDGHF
jgi:hypothetical protein